MNLPEAPLEVALADTLALEEVRVALHSAPTANRLLRQELRQEFDRKKRDLYSVASGEIERVRALEKRVRALEKERPRNQRLLFFWYFVQVVLGVILPSMGLMAITAKLSIGRGAPELVERVADFDLLALIAFTLFSILSGFVLRMVGEDSFERAKVGASGNYKRRVAVLKREAAEARKRLGHFLVSRVTLPFVRGEIANIITTTDATEIGWLNRTGLGEVYDPELDFQIDTPPHRKLERLISEMEAGTIGVAGPRGSGKTSLLRFFTRTEVQDKSANSKRRLGLLVSAPIEYEVRDFVLYLFAEVCYAVQKLVGVRREEAGDSCDPGRELEGREDASRRTGGEERNHRFWWYCITFVGVSTVVFSLVGLLGELLGGELPGESEVAARFLKLLMENKGELFVGGLGVLILASAVNSRAMALIRNILDAKYSGGIEGEKLLGRGRNSRSGGRVEELESPKGELDSAGEWESAYYRAEGYLEEIQFQQSYSSGWKGSLNVQVLGAETSVAKSLHARQRSLPEIVRLFRRFIESLPLEEPAVIGIDELDKLGSTEKISRFVDDIKAVFGLPRCIFLVSVSEEAMSRFKRRGLPARDAFDSAFDEVVAAESFDLQHSMSLLNRRVIGLSRPFHALCHLLAGGLAREVIRVCRTMLSIRDSVAAVEEELEGRVSFERVMEELILYEVHSKLSAIELSEIGVRGGEIVLNVLRGLEGGRPRGQGMLGPDCLFEAANKVVRECERRIEMGGGEVGRSDMGNEKGSPWEIGAYLIYLGCVMELMEHPQDRELYAAGGGIDRLARLRETVSRNAVMAWEEMANLRLTRYGRTMKNAEEGF